MFSQHHLYLLFHNNPDIVLQQHNHSNLAPYQTNQVELFERGSKRSSVLCCECTETQFGNKQEALLKIFQRTTDNDKRLGDNAQVKK